MKARFPIMLCSNGKKQGLQANSPKRSCAGMSSSLLNLLLGAVVTNGINNYYFGSRELLKSGATTLKKFVLLPNRVRTAQPIDGQNKETVGHCPAEFDRCRCFGQTLRYGQHRRCASDSWCCNSSERCRTQCGTLLDRYDELVTLYLNTDERWQGNLEIASLTWSDCCQVMECNQCWTLLVLWVIQVHLRWDSASEDRCCNPQPLRFGTTAGEQIKKHLGSGCGAAVVSDGQRSIHK